MLIRIFGAALISLCGIYASAMLNRGVKSTCDEAAALVELVRFVRSQIECFACPIPKIFERCPRELLCRCGYAGDKAKKPKELYESFCFSDAECAHIMESFFSQIGKGYRDEQLSLCEYFEKQLEERRSALAAALPARRRTNSVLCVCSALAAVIIFV